MKISVALAAYKGEDYIAEQLDSILGQLSDNDEIIVSDDYPQGNTRNIVMEYINRDKRIRYIEGEGKGVVKNFENALRCCTGDVVFLCDQDDVWSPDKVKTVVAEIKNGADLVLHDAAVTNGELSITEPSFFSVHKTNTDYRSNLIRNTFVGCCMAFTKQVMLDTIPFPDGLPMHDWWIALVAIKKGYNVVLVKKPLIKWCRHGGNVTGGKTGLLQKIMWRAKMIRSLAKIK